MRKYNKEGDMLIMVLCGLPLGLWPIMYAGIILFTQYCYHVSEDGIAVRFYMQLIGSPISSFISIILGHLYANRYSNIKPAIPAENPYNSLNYNENDKKSSRNENFQPTDSIEENASAGIADIKLSKFNKSLAKITYVIGYLSILAWPVLILAAGSCWHD